jgi:glycosyltransferase involved in cell wall biosynthesis
MSRVLLAIKGLGRGGAEQLVLSYARHLDRSRFEVEVAYLLPWKDALVSEIDGEGVAVHCLDGASGVGWIARLKRLVRDRRIDLTHVHSPYVAIGARLGLSRDMPLVYTEHNVWDRYHRATYWGNLLTFPRNDFVFAVSNHVRDSVRYPSVLARRAMPPLVTLYHGPDPAEVRAASETNPKSVRRELGIPPGTPVVGTVANLKAHKGQEYLLRAARIVTAEIPETRFVVVGQGPMEPLLRRRARELGLDGEVIFAGFREDALRLTNSFDLFVLPSLQEGLSIALIEAMALRKAVVVTSVGGLPEVVEDGIHGSVVPPRDHVALAESIVRLLRDEGLRSSFGEASHERARAFDIRRAVTQVGDVYQMLLQ